MDEMEHCSLCVRRCGADRRREAGICGVPSAVLAARAALHMWEEPCISGKEGSGAVFFSGCPLHCVFCQNRDIASGRIGKEITVSRLSEIFLELQEKGANNINLVTPTQYVPQIIEAVSAARATNQTRRSLSIPIVYNTGSYETPETVNSLKDTVDVWLPDMKYFDKELSSRYSKAPDYFETAAAVIAAMVKLAGAPQYDSRGIITRGVIVRHMVLPGHTRDSMKILAYLHDTYGSRIVISLMSQYTPMPGIEKDFPELARPLSKREYKKTIDFAIEAGIDNAYIQEGETAKESFIPAFDYIGL